MTVTPKSRPWPLTLLASAVLLAACAYGGPALAEPEAGEVGALADLSMEELMRVEIVSASRRIQALSDVPNAVHVITREDILRTGVRTLPEALRLAPGVDVAQMSPSGWAVGVRGEAGRFSNKLQVLVDGRSVFSPLYSGVLWEAERVPLEDVERIEIIRGPAGAVWGANAVNGVINVITREAGRTKGDLVVANAGTDGSDRLLLRHEMGLSPTSQMRVYAQADRQGGFEDAHGHQINNSARGETVGMRWDQSQTDGTHLSLQGQLLQSIKHGDVPLPTFLSPGAPLETLQSVEKAMVMASLEKPLSAESELRMQTVLQNQSIRQKGYVDFKAQAVDLDVQHRWHPRDSGHDIIWGVGVTWYQDHVESIPVLTFSPDHRTLVNTRLFAQHEYSLIPDRLVLTYGARIEHDPYSGTQASPDARLLWKIDRHSSSWVAVSRAVRAPGRLEADGGINDIGNGVRGVVNPGARIVEKVNALEAGWRSQVRSNLSVDVAGFIQNYDPVLGAPANLLDIVTNPLIVGQTTINGQLFNVLAAARPTQATTRGIEVAVDWRINQAWRQQLAFSHMNTRFAHPLLASTMGGAPRDLVSLRESYDFNSQWLLDLWLRYTSARQDAVLPFLDAPSRTALDVNLRWLVVRDMTISVGAHNLGPRQVNQLNPGVSSPVPRAAFAKIEASF